MKRLATVLITSCLILALHGTALSIECIPPEKATETAIQKMLKDIFPYKRVCKTPVKGVYEVIGKGNRIIYVDPVSGSVLLGILVKDGKNLTQMRHDALIEDFVKSLPLEKAVKMGEGPKVVIEFSDPDCPFCRKAHKYFSTRKDVTLYTFLFPITSIHPQAYKKSLHILCSEDPAKEYDRVLSGEYDQKLDALKPCEEKASTLEEHMKLGEEAGVEGTPSFFIKGRFVRGFNQPLIEQLLE